MRFSKTTVLASCLFASLIGNLLLGGMAVGRYYGGHQWDGQLSLKPILRVMKDLSPEQRQKVEAIIESARATLKKEHAALQQEREFIQELMLAPEVDKKQVQEAFSKYRQLVNQMQDTIQPLIIEASLALPLEQRKMVLEGINKKVDNGR